MSPIKLIGKYGFPLLAALLAFAGCGTPNDQAPFDADAGKHASGWVKAKHASVAVANSNACRECHGSDLAGGISGAPCSQCHLNGSPLALTGCTSCHGKPPDGTIAPNRAGAHGAHFAFNNAANSCNSCHTGAGTGTLGHDNGIADVAFLDDYNARSGTAVRNPDGTCSKVSCHGGQTTPAWLSGATIDVNTQCTACHEYGSSEYNSFMSGKHDEHVRNQKIKCEKCHDTETTALSAVHFADLATPIMEGPASSTLRSDVNYSGGLCTPRCHGKEAW